MKIRLESNCHSSAAGRPGWLAVLLLAYTVLASPAQAAHQDEAGAGQLLLESEKHSGTAPAPHLSSDVEFQVNGLIAKVTVKQVFRNDGSEWAEGRYLFPLPEDAAVNSMLMEVGERRIQGQIQEKAKAEKTYTEAKKAGKIASLVAQQRPNLFSQRVANIPPGEKVTVTLSYLQTVTYDQGRFSLRFPMTITPRYIPGAPLISAANDFIAEPSREQEIATQTLAEPVLALNPFGWGTPTDAVPDADKITPPMLAVSDLGQRDDHGIKLQVQLNAGLPIASISSAYHDILVERQNQLHQVQLRNNRVPMDRDFELSWEPVAASTPQAALFTEEKDNAQYALLMILPPPMAEPAARLPREVIYVLDTSGSMAGNSMPQAKQALQLALDRLAPGDLFNVIEFNSTHSKLFSHAQAASRTNIQQALQFVQRLQADGGTEMAPALAAALAQPEDSGRLRQVVFITDGSVGNETALFQQIRRQLGSARLFTVGIGSAPNSFFMRKAAQFGRGSFTYIGDPGEIGEKMGALFSKLEKPMMRNLQLDWPAHLEVESWPREIPDLYAGEPMIITARLDDLAGELLVSGVTAASARDIDAVDPGDWQTKLPLLHRSQSQGISSLWARRKIEALEDDRIAGADAEATGRKITQIALQHQLISRYTSFVAVEQQISRTPGTPLHAKAIPNLYANGQTMRVAYPRTATDAPWHLRLTLVFLMLALLLWLWPRRQSLTALGG